MRECSLYVWLSVCVHVSITVGGKTKSYILTLSYRKKYTNKTTKSEMYNTKEKNVKMFSFSCIKNINYILFEKHL